MTGSYAGRNSLSHAGALGATWLLVESGVDADIQRWASRQSETFSIAFSAPALIAGGVMGWAIGRTVGTGFAQDRLQPVAAPGRLGLQLTLDAG